MSSAAKAMHSPAALALAGALGLKRGRANLEVFAETLLEMARADRQVLAVTSDSRGSGKLTAFGKALPDQIVEVGIAEQNLVGISAGLASAGKKVFAVSPACFLTARSLEQIKNDVAYSDNPVNLIGISAGVSYGALGSTHHSLHDLAALRAIHNLDLVIPADNAETVMAIQAAARNPRPTYIRFGKAPLYDLPGDAPTPGRARLVRDGTEVAFIATGECVIHALLASEQLYQQGISCRVLGVHTLRPLDTESILAAARQCRSVVTVEEHSIHGGLGEACAGLILQAGLAPGFRIVGLPDEHTVIGSQADLFHHYGISMEGLCEAVRRSQH